MRRVIVIDGLRELPSLDALTGSVNIRQFRLALDQELDRLSGGRQWSC
ncbi:MAG: hypothetical protein JSW48_12595 [Betaproteobacteria bacterium]|nr:MAG: hypothetical protein JSW48_12595 [Betaproteobacteria bacterium]